jgi:methylated-DNA-[protein]-cysteine S-methyltransferase
MTLTHTSFLSPLGKVCVAANTHALCGVWFADSYRVPDWMLANPMAKANTNHLLKEAARQLQAYWAGERKAFDLPLDVSWGTPFQQSVWRQLLTIPYGHSCTYADVARAIGKPLAVRAVGTAIGRNPLSVVVPCHRVLGAQGQLGGYSGGLDRKRDLLALEQANTNWPINL